MNKIQTGFLFSRPLQIGWQVFDQNSVVQQSADHLQLPAEPQAIFFHQGI
jgi:hypothetical protein